MPQIRIEHLTFAYEGSYDNVFEDVSISIDTDWKLGFIGRNGRGKTTLLRLLEGAYTPQEGCMITPMPCTYFPFALPPSEHSTANVLDGLCPGQQEWEWRRELKRLELADDAYDRPFSTLSNGERTKAQLAALFIREDRFLLIDEPTNHLDIQARQAVARYLNSKRGFLLVSHDRRFLDGCTNHILSINKTGLQLIKGNFSSWQLQKERQDAFELAENEKRLSEIKHLSEAARRTGRWSDAVEKTRYGSENSGLKVDRGYVGHQSAKMMKRSKAIEARRENAIAEKEKLLKDIEYASPLRISPRRHHASTLLEARALCIAYGEAPVFSGLSFSLQQRERLALTGRNGSGKSSILKLIMGEDIPHTGVMHLASGLVLSYVPQDTSFLAGDLTSFARASNIDESLFKTILRKLDFLRVQFEKDMREFSAGQRKKVLIARSLCEQAHIYLWDEPLNYVDVLSRMQIEALIKRSEQTMLLIEHDSAFIDAVATRELEIG